MSRFGCLLLILVASTQVVQAAPHVVARMQANVIAVSPAPVSVPTVTVSHEKPPTVPTVTIPEPMATPAPTKAQENSHKKPHHKHHRKPVARPKPRLVWIWAYLTSYCPGSAGWLSSSGAPVYYGMLANNYYRFGTKVYLPVIGITGVVEDRLAAFPIWNHFDVWSSVCYGTPTGWFRAAIAR